ncbi:pyridoxamine 5'-phosphate oxidase family protein [Candidatus Undinarchaeota archaeon]
MLTDEIKKLFESQDIVAFATADEAGNPNVAPIYWKKIVNDSTIWLIDNYMLITAENIQNNPKVCVSFWDDNAGEGYKFKGEAVYHTSGDTFEDGKKWIQSINAQKNPKGVVEIKITEVYTQQPGPEAGKRIDEK